MGVLIPTTTIAVLRRPADGDDTEQGAWVDPYDEQEAPTASGYLAVRTGVRADISSPAGGRVRLPGGVEQTADALLVADPCGLKDGDVILDERLNQRYTIQWFFNYDAAGHLVKSSQAALRRTTVGD